MIKLKANFSTLGNIILIIVILLYFYNLHTKKKSNKNLNKVNSISRKDVIRKINNFHNKNNDILNKKICYPKKDQNLNMQYISGWNRNSCEASITTSLFFESKKCVDIGVLLISNKEELKKLFLQKKLIRVKSDLNYLEYNLATNTNSNNFIIRFCKSYNDYNNFNLISINWLPYDIFYKFNSSFKIMSIESIDYINIAN